MVDIVKPDISSVWAEAGAVIAPSNEKIKLGWTSEVPPHQYENFVQNRQDEMLAYLNQKGVPEWRTGTEYFLGKSFVQDAGKIYKANKNSGGLLPNQKPSTDATNEYWEQATFSLSDLKQAVGTSTKDVMSQKAVTDALAGVDKFNGTIVTIPSAAIVDLTALAPNTSQITISGTETINGFTVAAWRTFVVKFSGACTLANSAALVTGTGQDVVMTTGESCVIRATAANVVEIISGRQNVRGALNASGNAPMYACRAWVNFNGTGTVAIRASGNVSSITDNGVGDYTVNFTTAMTDENYAPSGVLRGNIDTLALTLIESMNTTRTSSSFRFISLKEGTGKFDTEYASLNFVR